MFSYPRKGLVNTDDPEMVRVQLGPNDVRSFRRRDADEIMKATPGAFILGDQAESEPDEPASAKGRRSAANKAREPKAE